MLTQSQITKDPTRVDPAMLPIQDGEYVVNLNMIATIERKSPTSWDVIIWPHAEPYTFEGDDLTVLKSWLADAVRDLIAGL